jgi:hypothetical protein
MENTSSAERALDHWQNIVARLLFWRGMVNCCGWKKIVQKYSRF